MINSSITRITEIFASRLQVLAGLQIGKADYMAHLAGRSHGKDGLTSIHNESEIEVH